MTEYKFAEEIEVKLRVRVLNNEPNSTSGYGEEAFLEVENITEGIWGTIYDTIVINKDAKERILKNVSS